MTTALRLAVAVGLTGYLFWRAHPQDVLQAAANAQWRWIAAAAALVLLDRTLMAYRWLVLLRTSSAGPLPLRAVLRVFLVSTFVGTFLPASVGGDAVRSIALARHGVPMADAVASVLVDRVLGTVSLLLLAAASIWFAPPGLPGWLAPVTLGLAIVGCIAVVLGLFDTTAERWTQGLIGRFTRGKLHKAGTNLLTSLRSYNHYPRALGNVLVGSIGVQLLRITQAWLLGLALGLTPGFTAYLVYIPVILVVMLLPVTINGLGTSQAAFVWLFAASGVATADAFALSILFLALGTLGNLPGGLLYATGGLHGQTAPATAQTATSKYRSPDGI
jgi:hypothetical protein